MKKNKTNNWKRLTTAGLIIFCATLFQIATVSPSLAGIKLKMGNESKRLPPQNEITKILLMEEALDGFAKVLNERSNGEISIDIFYGTKGAAKDLFGQTMMGTLDMVAFTAGTLSYFKGGENFSLLWVPYLFQTPEEFSGWLQSDMARGMMGGIEKNMNIKILGPIFWRSNRQITTSDTPVWSMADMKGLKFRTPPARIFTETFKSWGAIPTPMPYPELFMALKQGVVEGQDNGIGVVIGSQFYTVQKYMSLTDHMMGCYLIAMNMKRWQAMTADQQKLIQDVRQEMLEWQVPKYKQVIKDYLNHAASQGLRVIIPDLTEFKNTSLELNRKLDAEGTIWEKGLYEKVENWLKKNYR